LISTPSVETLGYFPLKHVWSALSSETGSWSGFDPSISANLALGISSHWSRFHAYLRVFNAGFIWDDESHLTRNPVSLVRWD